GPCGTSIATAIAAAGAPRHRQQPRAHLGKPGATMGEPALTDNLPAGIDQTDLVCLACPVDAGKPLNIFSHRFPLLPFAARPPRCPIIPCTGAPLEGATSYWASIVANPPGAHVRGWHSKRGPLSVLPAGRPAQTAYNASCPRTLDGTGPLSAC